MREAVIKVMKDQLDLDDNYVIEDTLRPGDIPQWDSLSHMLLVTRLEKEFQIRFSFDDMMEMDDFSSIVKMIEKLKK